MTDKTYSELLDDLDNYNERTKAATEQYEGNLTEFDITAISRSLNVKNTQVVKSTDTITPIGEGDGVDYIYNAATQTTWGVPAGVGAGETIVSVSGSDLITSGGSYTLYYPEKYPNVDSLKSTPLNEGQFASTTAYRDGWAATIRGPLGAANYQVVTKAEHDIIRGRATVDEQGDHTLINSNVALLLNEGAAYVEQYGAGGDATLNDTLAIDAASKTLDKVKFRGDGDYSVDAGVLTSQKNGQVFEADNSLDVALTYSGTGAGLIGFTVIHQHVGIRKLRFSLFDGVGLQIGTAAIKANLPYLEDINFNKCKTNFRCEHGNNGRWVGGFVGGNNLDLTMIGAIWNGESNNCNGWFVWGVRSFDCSIGFKLEGDSVDNRYVDDSFFYVSAENFSNVGFWVDGGIRNQINAYVETDLGDWPGAFGYRDTAGSRSNIAYLNGTASIDPAGGFNGVQDTSSPTRHITESYKYAEASIDLNAGSKSQDLTSAYKFFTVNNTTATASVLIGKLDIVNVNVPMYFFFPSTNTKKCDMVLDDPAGPLWDYNGTDLYSVIATGRDQLFEVIKLTDSTWTVREITAGRDINEENTKAIAGTTTLGLSSFKSGTIHNLDNTSGVTRVVTLTGLANIQIGFEMYFYNVSPDSATLTLEATFGYITGNSYTLTSGQGSFIKKIGANLFIWIDGK